jgi:hypothetical protein
MGDGVRDILLSAFVIEGEKEKLQFIAAEPKLIL